MAVCMLQPMGGQSPGDKGQNGCMNKANQLLLHGFQELQTVPLEGLDFHPSDLDNVFHVAFN